MANIPSIVDKGGDWFASIGTETSKGTKIFALAGSINNTGLIEVPMGITLREIVEDIGGHESFAQVINLQQNQVALQVFGGTKGLSTNSSVRFLGHPMRATYSANILGRVFRGTGEPVDGGPELSHDPQISLGGPSVNPMRRALASKMVRTDVPMIDVFNTLVESQKLPIFSVAGEPYNELLARIGMQADADIIILGGMGLRYDDYLKFHRTFEESGVLGRTILFVHTAANPVVECLLVPDLCLAVGEQFALQGRRVLLLLTDMTAFADSLKEISITMKIRVTLQEFEDRIYLRNIGGHEILP